MRYTLPEKFFCLHWCLFIEEEGKQLQHISTGLQDEEDFQHSEKDDQLVKTSYLVNFCVHVYSTYMLNQGIKVKKSALLSCSLIWMSFSFSFELGSPNQCC